jgi:hypothetical protein
MSVFTRRLQSVPVNCRAYSSFFSSKAGGRYFNSSKPPKSVVTSGNSNANKGKVETTTEGKDGSSGPASSPGNNNNEGVKEMMTSSDKKARCLTTSTHDNHIPAPPTISDQHESYHPLHYQHHPSIESKDFKLHQFFSLHRPLLLLSQPTSVLFEPRTDGVSVLTRHESETSTLWNAPPPPAHLGTLDDPPEASPEADADAARQLGRALVMSRVGGMISWESTLRRLGIEMKGVNEEVKEVTMESTKRKRKSKMKKHK